MNEGVSRAFVVFTNESITLLREQSRKRSFVVLVLACINFTTGLIIRLARILYRVSNYLGTGIRTETNPNFEL